MNKHADKGKPSGLESQEVKSIKPTNPSEITPRDARDDPEKQRENQADLGVTPEHKTEDMEKGKRGTFP